MQQLHLFAPLDRVPAIVVDRGGSRSQWLWRRLRRSRLVEPRLMPLAGVLEPAGVPGCACLLVYVDGRTAVEDLRRIEQALSDTAVVAVVDGSRDLALTALESGAEETVPVAECDQTRLERAVLAAVTRKSTELRALRFASTDPLTGLANRTGLEEFLTSMDRCVGSDGEVAALCIDLDRFKPVNDTYGHRIGDLLLVQLAGRLGEALRDRDLVARVGGDEFVVVLRAPDVDRVARAVADRIVDTLGREVLVEGHRLTVSASVGIAVRRTDESTASLLARADTALYEAKRGGRARWVRYDDDLARRAAAGAARAKGVAEALRAGTLELRLQTLDPGPGDPSDTELLRARCVWQASDGEHFPARHPDHGRYAPGIFEWTVDRLAERGRRLEGTTVCHLDAPRALVHRVEATVARLERLVGRTGIRPVLVFDEADLPHLEELDALRVAVEPLGATVALGGFGGGGMSLDLLDRLPWASIWLAASATAEVGVCPVATARVAAVNSVARVLAIPVFTEDPPGTLGVPVADLRAYRGGALAI